MTTKQRFEDLVAKDRESDTGRSQEEREAIQKTAAARETMARMKEGEFPKTTELASAIDSITKDSEINKASQDMSPEGKKFMTDAERALETTKETLIEKNPNEELQKMVHHAQKATEAATIDRERLAGTGQELKGERAAAGELTRQAVNKITNVAKLTVTSSEFRTLLMDLTELFRDIVFTNVVPAAEKGEETTATQEGQTGFAAPSERRPGDETQQRQEEGWEFDTSSEQHRSGDETAAQMPGGFQQQQQQQQQNLGETTQMPGQEQQEGSPPSPGREAEADSGTHRAALKDTTHEATREAGRETLEGAQPFIDQMKQQDRSTREVVKEAGRKFTDTARGRVSAISLSDEQRDMLINRVKNVVREVHSSSEYQQAIEDLLDILSTLKARVASMTQSATQQAKVAATGGETHQSAQEAHLNAAVKNAKALVEHFANDRSLDPLYNEVVALMKEMREDREFDELSTAIKRYILRALRDTAFVDSPQFIEEGRQLVSRTRDVIGDRYNRAVDRTGRESQQFLEGFREDELTMKLSNRVQDMVRDMFIDEESGKPTIKMNLAKDLARLIPVLAQKVRFIPIPRIEGADENYEYAIDNLVVSANNIMPEHVRLSTQTDLTKLPESSGKYDVNNLLAFTIQNIHAVVHKVAFYYKKKSGIARMADAGYADILIEGRGLDIGAVVAAGNPHDNDRSFQVLRVDVLVHDISLSMHETKRDLMYKLFSPIVKSIVRKRLEEGIATGLMEFMVSFDKQLTKSSRQSAALAGRLAQRGGEMTDEAKKRAQGWTKKKTGEDDPEKAQNIPGHIHQHHEEHDVQQQKLLQQRQQREQGTTGTAQPHTEPVESAMRKGQQHAM